jgi:uncharacterized membrane protein YdbT with pleckstrin-like domain
MSKTYLESLLSEREKVILIARQHWFLLASTIVLEIILIFLIFAFTIIASISFPPFTLWFILAGFVLLLLPLATMTRDILNWTNRQYVVTNRRVIQIRGIINKDVTDSSLEKVNDVKMAQSALGRTFNYGDIEILTASELGVNLFKRISDPIGFKTAMLNAKETLDRGNFNGDDEEMHKPTDIPALIAELDRLRQQGALTDAEFQQKKMQLLAKL